MKFEYEVFDSVGDLLMVTSSSITMAMRQISIVYLFDEYVISYGPVMSGEKDESLWVVSLAKGTLPLGLIEFDQETKKIEKISRAVNPEKSHFLVVKPSKSTILEKAIANLK